MFKDLQRHTRLAEFKLLYAALLLVGTSFAAVGLFSDRIEQSMQNRTSAILGADGLIRSTRPLNPEYEKLALEFEVLSDVGNKVAKSFGLVFKLSEKMQEIYKNFGIDLPTANGDQSFELPIPATYVVTKNGIIAFAFIDADYTNRLDPEIIVSELKKL